MSAGGEMAFASTAAGRTASVEDTATDDAVVAAMLLAIAPEQLKGAVLYCESRALGDIWLDMFHAMLPSAAPCKRVPGNISDERLLGGLDFAATIARGSSVSSRGLLAESHGGCAVFSASTTRASSYAHAARALDHQAVQLEREGLSEIHPTSFAALVMQAADDETVPAAMADRLAFHIPLLSRTHRALFAPEGAAHIAEARRLFPTVHASERVLVTLTNMAAQMGIGAVRAVLLALSAARAHAALYGRMQVASDDVVCAVRLVLAPRATATSHEQPPESANETEGDRTPREQTDGEPAMQDALPPAREESDLSGETKNPEAGLTEILVRTAPAAMPPGMLTAFAVKSISSRGSKGRSGDERLRGVRGRQVGVRRGDPRGGARLDLVATLRAAVPLQRIRRAARRDDVSRPVELRREDFRIRQCVTPAMTTALFVVDASGSAAMQRLAEAKGAVEMMLAEGYARRDRVALITFRGKEAQLVLPATHALARARRAISGLPAGGGTPLATALDLATTVLQQMQRSGGQFMTIILTDGRANVGRDGQGGRARAMDDALHAAERLRVSCDSVLWVDTSAAADENSQRLAARAGARYLLLPSRNANGLTDAVRETRVGAQ